MAARLGIFLLFALSISAISGNQFHQHSFFNEIRSDTSYNLIPESSGSTVEILTHLHFDPFLSTSLTRDVIDNLPVRDFTSYLTLFPSTWQQDEKLQIRAGRIE